MTKSILTKSQFKTFTKNINYRGTTCTISVTLRYDDECNNGHNTFSITGRIKGGKYNRYGYKIDTSGCLHDEIKKYFPEFAHLIKWHLCNSDAPMHYIENTLYFASNSASLKYKVGEPNKWDKVLKFENSNITHKFSKDFIDFLNQNENKNNFEVVEVPYKEDTSYNFEPKYTFKGYDCEWYQCPFNTKDKAIEYKKELESKKWTIQEVVTGYQKGKQREFDAARQSAIWKDATDEQLSLPSEKLKKLLLKRLPKLMKEFKHDIEALGFIY